MKNKIWLICMESVSQSAYYSHTSRAYVCNFKLKVVLCVTKVNLNHITLRIPIGADFLVLRIRLMFVSATLFSMMKYKIT